MKYDREYWEGGGVGLDMVVKDDIRDNGIPRE